MKTADNWNPHDSIHGLFARANESLKVQEGKSHAAITRGFVGHSKAGSMEDSMLDASDLCWEKLNSNMGGFSCTLIKTTYGDKPNITQIDKFWKIVNLMVRVFLRRFRKEKVGEEMVYG